MVSFAKPSGNVLKAANSAIKKMTTAALSQAKTSTDKIPENFKSALELALESLDGLQGCLELHIITALKLKEIEVLLSGAKAGVKNAAALKCVNIISPLTDQTKVGPSASTTGIFSKIFEKSVKFYKIHTNRYFKFEKYCMILQDSARFCQILEKFCNIL